MVVLETRYRKLITGILKGMPKQCSAWRIKTPAASVLRLWGLLWGAEHEWRILIPLCLQVFHLPSWGGAAPAWAKPAFREEEASQP